MQRPPLGPSQHLPFALGRYADDPPPGLLPGVGQDGDGSVFAPGGADHGSPWTHMWLKAPLGPGWQLCHQVPEQWVPMGSPGPGCEAYGPFLL